jgi:CPA2 family monovalent cation:H+ antiporter-2
LVSQLGLSLPLGAFLAGLALSESDFCYLVKTEIYPFRGLLLGLFFVTVGMSLNWPLALQHSGTVVGLLAGLLIVKSITLWAIARLSRYCQGFSIRLGLLLAQGSEFAFVLLALATAQGLLTGELGQLLQVCVGLSLALTPALSWMGRILSQRIEQGRVEEVQSTYNPDAPKVIITGFNEIGQEIAKVLEAEGIDYIAYDGDRDRIALARSKGFQVGYADMNRPKTATAVSVGDATAVIILLEDLDVSLYLIDALKHMNTTIPVYTVTYDDKHYQQVLDRKVENTLLKDHNTSREITSKLMRHLLYSDEQIESRLERMARDQQAALPQSV